MKNRMTKTINSGKPCRFKKVISILIIINVVFTYSIFTNAAVQIPENIRIGLYYESTAVPSFNISAEKGIQIGSYRDNSYVALYSEPSNNALTIRKDAYFVNVSSKLTSYNTTDKTIPAGEKIGPYHVKIGTEYADENSASSAVQELIGKGIAAYMVFVDVWQVWTGFYTDQISAQSDITNNIQPKVPDGVFNIIQPVANRIVVTTAGGITAMIFGSDVCRFQIHPTELNIPYVFKLNSNKDLIYRGDLEVRRFTGSDMTLINIIPTEQYLYGVVPAEIQSSSGPEALKAQAVAARTYILNNLDKHDKYDFNLCTTTSCQVYKGYDGENAATNKAVDDTAGIKVIYDGKPAEIFYFSSSGGFTEDVKNVWGSSLPYLTSVEDKYESSDSWHYNWETTITAEKVYTTLKGRGYDLGEILSMNITKTADTGRVTELVITGTKGQRVYKLDGCRTVFGLDSQWYSISTDADASLKNGDTIVKAQLGAKKVMTASGLKDLPSAKDSKVSVIGADGQKNAIPLMPINYVFVGKGWGHAVGMSQEGARGMAKAGFTYDQILEHYFPGTVVG